MCVIPLLGDVNDDTLGSVDEAVVLIGAQVRTGGREEGQRSGEGEERETRALGHLELGRDIFHKPPGESPDDSEGDDVGLGFAFF